jgi:hypothetical protein
MGYSVEGPSVREFFDFMTTDTFSGDVITLDDVLKTSISSSTMWWEISELEKMSRRIDK